jgi:hypothetical protein
MLYNSTQHIFMTMTKSHTNVSQTCANLISIWIDSNKNMMQANPITTSMSQRYWKLGFAKLPQYVNYHASLPLEFCIV